ncbi:AI-2E family transporter [Actinomyces wuliandei]|uniref:AI-2E family transporter n=1 Tax=Actinomyces wuliandei TaxID=2057743 RepID=UPI001FA99040|nr:AI-2E family transporter [Actinomyces wuliandei]
MDADQDAGYSVQPPSPARPAAAKEEPGRAGVPSAEGETGQEGTVPRPSPGGATRDNSMLAHLRHAREALDRTIDRVEERRQADRAAHLRYQQEAPAPQDTPGRAEAVGPTTGTGTCPVSTGGDPARDEPTASPHGADNGTGNSASSSGTSTGEEGSREDVPGGMSPTRGNQAAGSATAGTTGTAPVVPATVTTRSSALASLPRWLVRGGLGAWLLLGVIIIVSLMVFVTARVVPVFVGLFIALVLTSILQPLVGLFGRVMPRYPATFLALLTALASLVGLVAYVVASVTDQWDSLAAQFSDGLDTIVEFVETGPLPLHVTQQQLTEQFQDWVSQGQDYLQNNAPSLASEVLSNASGLVDFFAVMALAVFSTIFFLASGEKMWRWFLNELPAHLREPVHRAAGAGWYTFAGYARGTVIVALTDAVMAGIFLQLVGIPLAAPLAVLVFIGAFIPLIGAPVAMVIAMVVALASQGPLTMVVVGLGVAGIGQIEGHILQPLIMGRQVSLHPVVVIIAVAVGTYSAGLLGAIVAVPVISVAWSVYSELHVRDAPVLGALPSYTATRRE